MKTKNNTAEYTAKQVRFASFFEDKFLIPINDKVIVIDQLMEDMNLRQYLNEREYEGIGRIGYNPVKLLKTILFGYADTGYVSLRELEDRCKTNIRYMYLMDYETPSYRTFGYLIEECLTIIANRPHYKVEPIIDGYAGFLYLDKDNNPMAALHWEKYFQHALEKFNSIYKDELPKITPHVCRHTFCSNMAKAGMNPKTLQYIMGYADIGVTLNTYTQLSFDDAKEEMDRLVVNE